MATRIRHKRSAVAGKVPLVSQLESGELAINTADGKVFLLRDDNTIQDLTTRVFSGDSELRVTDYGDSAQATISAKVNGVEQLQITEAGVNIKDALDMENATAITFRELTASGEDGVSIKAPDTLPASYELTLPLSTGTVGQLLRTDGNGQLDFVNADLFGGNVVYVSAENGDDDNDGINAPVKTVKRACQIASGLVYNPDGTTNNRRINIKVAVGDYTEQNPVIVPDNTVIKGDGLRGCIIRPANANQDILRVRNACYFGEFTFRDGVDANQVPLVPFDYAVSFDDPFDTSVSRVGYTNLPSTRPTITISPYVQNCSIISFLGGSGAKIDGAKVQSPNVPRYPIEAENPAVGAVPEQGKSMVANAFTMLTFGGTGWRLTNDAYAQIVSCFQIFLLNGVYCQSGGYCSITNSATNFGLYALRSSGFSPKAFVFDRAHVVATGQSEGKQTLTIVGINRDTPVEEFVIRFRNPDYKTAYTLLKLARDQIAQDTIDWINAQIAAATPSIWSTFSYNQDKCQRDVQLIVDALAYDIMFNSNYRSIKAGIAYYRGNASDVVDNQKAQTVESLEYLKDVIVSNIFGSSGTAATRANALMDEIIDIVQNGEAAADAFSYPTPTSGTNNASDAGFLNAAAQVLANKDFIADEITNWIADESYAGNAPFSRDFSYNFGKCQRDTGLILDAVGFDIALGTNYNSVTAGLAYTRANTAYLQSSQLTATAAAIASARDDVLALTNVAASGTATSRATTGFNEVIQILTSGVGAADALSFPAPSVLPTTDADDAATRLQNNRTFIRAEIIAWINANYPILSYDSTKCSRDVGYIVDALTYDILYGGNSATRKAAESYFVGSVSQLGAGEAGATAAAYAHLASVVSDIVQGTTITKSTGNSETQNTSGANATTTEGTALDGLVQIVEDVITAGSISGLPAESLPSVTWATTALQDARSDIVAARSTIIVDTINYINTNYPSLIKYNLEKCKRDYGFLVDALVYDLTYGGNLETSVAANAYFTGAIGHLGSTTEEESAAAYGRFKTIVGQIIQETAVTTSSGTLEVQDTTGTAGSAAAATYAQARVQEVIDIIESSGAVVPSRIEPDVTWVSTELQQAGAGLLADKIFISQTVIEYINTQIQANLWYGFDYNESFCYRDTQLIIEAVAQDTWDTGNRYSRSAGLAYYRENLQDSSRVVNSGEQLQTIAAIEQASVYAAAVIADLDSDIRAFVDSKFDVIKTIINDPDDLPDPTEVSSEGDITNSFKPVPTTVDFDGAADINVATDIITIIDHGFTNGEKVIYDPNGNTPIQGLDPEQNYYVKIINDDEFSLTFDDSLEFDVNLITASTGTHSFLAGVIEFYVEEILSNHTTYQTLILESGAESYEFVPGRAITGTTGASNNSAYVVNWEPSERRLTVSIEEVAVGSSLLRIQFDATSIITSDHAGTPNTNIGVNETAARTGLGTATFTITATDGSSSLTNLVSLPEQAVWFHRPSIVNSSAHTWEYSGSGTDYNALPQNGGNTRAEYEQYAELPGRVYSSGTNELGDFKVGDFITAYNRTGNITFRNKVQVDELDALRLTLSDIAIEEISNNVNLGDDEIGGPSDSRLATQLATRSFISNRLGGFVDKTVSTAAVPGAIVQLNTNGQLNPDLIPATRQFTSTNTKGYLSRLLQVDEIPAVDLKAGDIGTEEYEQVELTLPSGITAADGDVITQPGIDGAIGYAKGSYSTSLNILVASQGAEWIAGDDSTGDPWDVSGTAPNLYLNGVDTGIQPSTKGSSSAITDNFFLKSSNTSQYLLLESDETYTFTSADITDVERNSDVATATTSAAHNLKVGNNVQVLIEDDVTFNENTIVLSTPTTTTFTYANVDSADPTKASASVTGTARTIVTSADGNAQGAVTEARYGIATNVDNANITQGSGYTPVLGTEVYEMVALTNVSGSGTGAYADITITAGQVTDVDMRRGGTGYAPGDILSCSASSVGGTGAGFQIEVVAIENRAYVNILGGELFVASASSIDFVEDNTSVDSKFSIHLDDFIEHNFLAGTLAGGGDVDYTDHRISYTAHGWSNGDPVTYNTNGNTPIGGLLNGSVYYVKYIDADTFEVYEDFALLNQVEFLSTPANNAHTFTRYNVNLTDNSIIVPNHGFTTGDAFRIELTNEGDSAGVALFSVSGTETVSGARFFVGSVTTNSFTIHELRSDALSSINGLVTNAKDIDATGQGNADIIPNNVQVSAVVNTSSRIKANWNSLAVTNIDASNIISGTISPSRLAATGVANSDSALFGDSSYKTVVQSIKKATTTDNPITLTGSSLSGEFYGDPVNIGIANADYDPLGTFSTLGTSRFLQTQFNVNSDGSGEVFIKDGVVDAGTLDSLDSAYFLNPANLTSPVPVARGGTNITTYAVGDILYAQSTGTLNTLNIGRNNSFLKSDGTYPVWGTALDLSEGLDVGSAKLTSGSVGSGSVYDTNVTALDIGGDAENIKIGKSTDTRTITSYIDSFDASVSTDVVVNFGSLTQTTNAAVGNGDKEIPMSDTTGILAGMIVTGSASIPANTTVSGVTDEYVYLSTETTGTILTTTTLTFTYTPQTIGIKEGDTINIASSLVTNLDGSWPVVGATFNATSFTVRTDANVTVASAAPLAAGLAVTKDNTIVFKNRRAIFGSAEASTIPVNATLRGENAIGTDTAGGDFIIQAGLGTGNATGGDFIVKTGETSTTSDLLQTATTRLTINTQGKAAFTGEVEVNDTISTTETTVGLLDDTATTINMGGAATTVEIGAATGTTTVHNNVDIDLDLNVDGGDITTNAATFNLLNTNATTINAFGAATAVGIGASTGTTTVNNNLTVTGDLTVNGTNTVLNTTELNVDDKNITMGSVATPTDSTADGGGITLKGATDKTINWDITNANWTSSENWNLASGKVFKINNASVLSSTTLGTGVVNSSLQTLGTIGTGVWQGTIISPTYGGTGINNGTKTITLGGNLTTSGAFASTFTMTGATSVTFPTSGTLARTESPLSQFAATTSAQLAGVISDETGSGALVFGTSPTFTTSLIAGSATMALLNTTATTVNAFGAATTIDIGAATGTTSINNNVDIDLDLNVDGGDITTNATTFNLLNANATTVNAFKAATTLDIGAATGTTSINNNVDIDLDLNVDGGDLTTNATTFNLVNSNATTVNFAGGAGAVNIGAATSTTTIADDLTVNGNVTITAGGTLTLDSINGTPIGNVTPSSGAFTTLTASGLSTITNTTASTSTSTGALVISGGLGVAGAVYASDFWGSIAGSQIDSGTIPDARIQASGVTQHQASITGTGALNSGSITSGFGSIDIGTSTFTGNGSGLTDLSADNLATGTVAGARLGGNQTMAGVKTFSDTTESSAYTNGGAVFQGGVGVAKNLRVNGTIYGNGSGLTTLNASNISSGTINDARLPTTQTGKTFSSDITANSHKVGRGGGNSATNLAVAGGQAISSGTDNSVFGVGAMAGIVTGTDNTAIGNTALASLTSATHNTAVGNDSQAQRTSAGNYNTSVGAQSMTNSTAGSSNTGVGYQALELVTGSNNTTIGALAGDNITSGSANIVIGYNAKTSAATASNEIVIGTATQTSMSVPGVNLSVSTTTFNFTGTTGFSGVGTNLTALNASNLSSGTVPDARIAATSITQHQGSITGTGILNSGSITSGFGSIDIGADNLTATGTVSLGATSFNDNNITNVGSIALDSITADGTDIASGSLWRFTNVTDATSTTAAAIELSGGLAVAKSIYFGGTIYGTGSGLTSLDASNLSSGTVASARVSGSYTGITGTGALDAGQITSNFGDINIGTSTFTGNGSGLTSVDAATLDSIDSTSFLRSDANDTATGVITMSGDGERFRIASTTATNSPYMAFAQGATRRAYIQYVNGGTLRLAVDATGERLDIGSGLTGLTFYENVTATSHTVWHSGNDGAGSGLDADTLDGQQGSYYTNADNLSSGTVPSGRLTGTYAISISGDAGTLDGIDSGSFLRSDAADAKTSGSLTINDNIRFYVGTDNGMSLIHSSNQNYLYLDNGDFFIADDGIATRFTFGRTTGAFTASGEITAYSDISLKDNINVVSDALGKITAIRGVTFTRTDLEDTERRHMGVIAQEVEQYFPEVVHTNEDGIKTVNYGAMAGAFIEAFKEQQSQIDELRAMVQKLLDK